MKHKIFDMRRALIHFPVGIITIWSGEAGLIYPFVLLAGFIIYELNEDMHVKDKAFLDIAGFIAGTWVAAVSLLALKFFTGG